MVFCDYFSSCSFLVPSRKNVHSGFFLFFLRGCLRACTRLTGNGERLGIFRRSDRTYTRERMRNRITFFRYLCRDAENASTSPLPSPSSRPVIIGLLYASPILRARDNKMPAGRSIEIRRYDLRIAAGWRQGGIIAMSLDGCDCR